MRALTRRVPVFCATATSIAGVGRTRWSKPTTVSSAGGLRLVAILSLMPGPVFVGLGYDGCRRGSNLLDYSTNAE